MDMLMDTNATEYTGPPDPVYGDERYRRIRVAAQVRYRVSQPLRMVLCSAMY